MEPAADAAVAISRFRAKNGWESCSDRKPSAAYRCGSMSGGSRFDARERDPFFGRFRAGARGGATGDEGDGKQVGRCLNHDALQYFPGKGQTTLGAGEYRRREAQCLLLMWWTAPALGIEVP